MNRFRKKLKIVDPKVTLSPVLGIIRVFLKKKIKQSPLATFKCLSSEIISDKSNEQLQRKSQSLIFRSPIISHLHNSGHNRNFT